ncbi:MAG: MiaB/RimO family radical SAM methylthiotransferase, partial [Pseudomonadota bacterium]
VREHAGHLVRGYSERTRAFVEVQTGCDHRCTFCIIPYGRGNARSVPAGGVIDEINRLVDQGIKEVVLTGVDITSYGQDLPGKPTLGMLVQRILIHAPDLPRLRLSSIDQVECDEPLYEAIADDARVMPHLHLSLQSGSDLILKRMKRRHLRHDAIAFCDRVRAARPDIVFGADFIAGFPTETEAQFEETLSLVDECGIDLLHVFPYSARTGTPAARMPQVNGAVRKARAQRLRTLGQRRKALLFQRFVGQTVSVLLETVEGSVGRGHTDHYLPIEVEGQTLTPGAIISAQTDTASQDRLIARALELGPVDER